MSWIFKETHGNKFITMYCDSLHAVWSALQLYIRISNNKHQRKWSMQNRKPRPPSRSPLTQWKRAQVRHRTPWWTRKHSLYALSSRLVVSFYPGIGTLQIWLTRELVSKQTQLLWWRQAQCCFVVSPLSKNKWVGASTRIEERVASCLISGDGLCRGEGPRGEEAQEKVFS
jgi:hypothetical protein